MRLAQLKTSGNEGTDEEFGDWLEAEFSKFESLIFVADINSQFEAGFGPVGVVGINREGDNLIPHVEWFPWSTAKNRLRGSVQFFMKYRRTGKGTMIVTCPDDAEKFFKNLEKYVPLFFVGKIPGGDPWGRGNHFIFYIKGRGR